jgi:adenylate kinase family enzyme
MNYKYVFLFGRPGCGKSAVYRELEKRLIDENLAKTFQRVDDFPKLWGKFLEDDKLVKEGKERIYSRTTDDGGYKVVNNDVWNEILKEVNADVLDIDKGEEHLVFIEFSRSNYIEALSNFSEKILDKCIVIYIDVAFEICWERNVARHEAALEKGGDDHLVSRDEMEATYLYDDRDELVKFEKSPVVIVDNEKSGMEHLVKQVDKVIDVLKK